MVNLAPMDYIKINKESWNKRTEKHFDSEFYDNEGFVKSPNSLNSIELELLPDLKGKKVLHLQCHFGQDSISLSKLGADVTAIDFSENAIMKANKLNEMTDSDVRFICADVYSLPKVLKEEFDVVFSSYGTIGWLPSIEKWAGIVRSYLKPGGIFVFAEFHPVVWMYDNDFKDVIYNYFKEGEIVEEETTYADDEKLESFNSVTWNHSLSSVINSLINQNLNLLVFNEFDYSPYDCFSGTEEFEKGKFRIKKFENKIPIVYALKMQKQM